MHQRDVRVPVNRETTMTEDAAAVVGKATNYNLANLFEDCVDVVPDRLGLIIDGDERLTYRELDEAANQVAHLFLELGIGAGDHVACHLYNGLPYITSMLACFKIRAVPVNVNYRYVREELRHLYDDSDAVAVVFDAEFADRVTDVLPELEGIRVLLMVSDDEAATNAPEGALDWATEVARQPTTRPVVDGRSDDDLYLLYTGGTTGMPKGVMWRHEDIFFAGLGGGDPVGTPVSTPGELAGRVAGSGEITMFSAPPLMHGAAFLGCFIGWFGGRTMAITRKFSGQKVAELMARDRVFVLSIVGDAMAVPIAEALESGEHDCSGLFIISSAGAILSQSVKDRLKVVLPQCHIMDNYGSSETGFNGTATDDSSSDSGLKFTVNDRTNVIADDITVIEPGADTIGRVAQTGHIPLGYYNAPVKTAETFVATADGRRWVLTGDRATVDADGVIHFIGRGSVCINSGGEKIFPEEVESAIKAHPAVRDVIVAGIPDERFGQRVTAVVELNPGAAEPTQAEFEEHLSTRVARYKIPRLVVTVESVVRSPAGKPDYGWATATAEKAALNA